MYNSKSTLLPERDPLAIEVFLNEQPPYLDDELANKIAVTVVSCGALPSAELITLWAAAGVHIRERVHGKPGAAERDLRLAADGHVAELFCWSAIQHDRRSRDTQWFDGGWRQRIWLLDKDWVRADEVGLGGYVGWLAEAVRRTLHVDPDFAPYWFARQGLLTAEVAVPGVPKPPGDRRSVIIGHNINRLRKECGWSFATLAEAIDSDSKNVRQHVAGKGMHGRTQAVYAKVFSRELHRTIDSADLEADSTLPPNYP